MNKRAFTLAEVLITLGIIGVVAVLTITSFVKNYQEKAWKTSAEVFDKKLTAAIDLMNTNDELAGYSTTEDFVKAFSKYAKIIKTCDESNIDGCWISGDAVEITISQCPDKKFSAIKAVRTCTGLGLRESKELVDNACAGTHQTFECNNEATTNELVSYGATAKFNDTLKLKNLEFININKQGLSYDTAQLIDKLGGYVPAIKFAMKCTGLSLIETKELVDAGGIINCESLDNVTDVEANIVKNLNIGGGSIETEKATTSVMGTVFADGTQALIIYYENCAKVDLSHSECVGIMYDTSGFKNPNSLGKDRGLLIK